MTFIVNAENEYARKKKLIDELSDKLNHVMKIEAEHALIVLARKKPLWTVENVNGDFELVSYTLNDSNRLIRLVPSTGKRTGIDQVGLEQILNGKWYVEKSDYFPHDAQGEPFPTVTATPTSVTGQDVLEEPGEGRDFIRIPNKQVVPKKVYPGSIIHIPTLDPGNRGNVFVVVKAITDADTIGCYLLVHTNGKSRVQYTQVKRSVVKDEWRWHREPDKQEAGIVGLDYVEMDGIQVREGMQLFIRGDAFKSSLENDLYQVSDQWADVEDLVSEEEALVKVRVQTPHGLQNMFEAVHGAYVEGIRDKPQEGK